MAKKDWYLLIGLAMIFVPITILAGWLIVDLIRSAPKWALFIIIVFIYMSIAAVLIEKGARNK